MLYERVEEEIAYGPSCWLWDYLRRSGANGFFLPLSGGADSSSTAALVGIMCQQVVKAIGNYNLFYFILFYFFFCLLFVLIFWFAFFFFCRLHVCGL